MPVRTVNTKFYTFIQTNSGGRYYLDENLGCFVIIEAIDHNDANARAEKIGVEFNDGCSCCGHRWDRMSSYDEGDATDEPMISDKPVREALQERWFRDYNVIIHYCDGTRAEFKGPEFKTR